MVLQTVETNNGRILKERNFTKHISSTYEKYSYQRCCKLLHIIASLKLENKISAMVLQVSYYVSSLPWMSLQKLIRTFLLLFKQMIFSTQH